MTFKSCDTICSSARSNSRWPSSSLTHATVCLNPATLSNGNRRCRAPVSGPCLCNITLLTQAVNRTNLTSSHSLWRTGCIRHSRPPSCLIWAASLDSGLAPPARGTAAVRRWVLQPPSQVFRAANQLLAAFAPDSHPHLAPHRVHVRLVRGQVIIERGAGRPACLFRRMRPGTADCDRDRVKPAIGGADVRP